MLLQMALYHSFLWLSNVPLYVCNRIFFIHVPVNGHLDCFYVLAVGEDSWESLGLQGDPTSPFWRRSALGFLWKEWCWSWNSSNLATWCEELAHRKRPWCWEGLGAGGEGDDRGWDGWVASLTRWTWVWVNSGSWWWTGGLACCDSWGRKESDTTEQLNWTELILSWTIPYLLAL